jgi:carbonic anhydrase
MCFYGIIGEYDFGTTTFQHKSLQGRPKRKLAVIACMDARLDLFKMLGLEEGDAHIIRNAGGIVNDDMIRSLIISQHLLGTEEVVLVHHTDCGMLAFDELDLRRRVESQAGSSFIPAFRAAFLTILPKSASPSGLSLLL